MIPITKLDDLYQFGGQSVAYQTNFQFCNLYGKSVRDPHQIMYGYVYKKAIHKPKSAPFIVIKIFEKYPGISYKFRISDKLLARSTLSLRFATPSEANKLYKMIGRTNYFPVETAVKLNKLSQEYFAPLLFIFGKSHPGNYIGSLPEELISIIINLYSQHQQHEFAVNQQNAVKALFS